MALHKSDNFRRTSPSSSTFHSENCEDSGERVLFLCTGNFYRSRFAEELFNHLARPIKGARWTADSSGLDVAYGSTVNFGPVSAHVIAAMQARGLPVPATWRHPKQAHADELLASRIIIALKAAEHRPLMDRLFPQFSPKVTYWTIDDVDVASPTEALARVESQVRQLLETLPASS